MKRLAIYGVGSYLPETIRTNDWWPESIVDDWRVRIASALERRDSGPPESLQDGALLVSEAMGALFKDPFRGSVERRVLDKDRKPSFMEVQAAEAALANANIDRSEIDFLIVQSAVPDNLMTSNACLVHRELGLRKHTFSMSNEGMCHSLLLQLVLAEQMVLSGQFKHGLLIQSSALTRMMPTEEQHSPWFGDGAAAVVVGPSTTGSGVLGHAHMTDGSTYGSLVSGVRGKEWYEEGRVTSYSMDPAAARRQFHELPGVARELTERALDKAGLEKADIHFWGCHQATPWMPELTRSYVGLSAARTLSIFKQTASISGANIGLAMQIAEKENLVRSGDLVAMHSGAAGMTASSLIIRWGR